MGKHVLCIGRISPEHDSLLTIHTVTSEFRKFTITKDGAPLGELEFPKTQLQFLPEGFYLDVVATFGVTIADGVVDMLSALYNGYSVALDFQGTVARLEW